MRGKAKSGDKAAKEAMVVLDALKGGLEAGKPARALGLDTGPMSGFDNAKVDEAFFPDGRFKSNFLCNLGKGVTDFHAVRTLLLDSGYQGWCTVEQDCDPAGPTSPIDDGRANRAYLTSIGFN